MGYTDASKASYLLVSSCKVPRDIQKEYLKAGIVYVTVSQGINGRMCVSF